jgi:hypothetical protein
METLLIREVIKARRIGKTVMKRPMRIRGTLFMKKSIDMLTLFTQPLGVLQPRAIAPGGT